MTARPRSSAVGLALAVTALCLVATASAVRAQSISQFAFGFPGAGTVLSTTDVGVRVSGELTVSFHGDVEAGCATYGLCGYSGTITVRPRSGDLLVLRLRRHHRIAYFAILALAPGQSGYMGAAEVERSAPGQQGGTCADAEAGQLGSLSQASVHGSSLTIAVLARGGSLLTTRCAGPLDGDLASVSPRATISARAASHGRTTLDLGGTHTFAAHGFAGTITSSLVVRLGKPTRSGSSAPAFPPGVKTQRVRTVTEHLDLTRVAGGVTAAVQGTADSIVCQLLDTCGMSGTLRLTPFNRGATAEVLAMGPASRPNGDFLAALGLNPSGRSRGIRVLLTVALGGYVSAGLNQSGGSCADTAPTGELALLLGGVGHRLTGQAVTAGTWRTRCPGPMFSNGSPLLSASLPQSSLGRRQFAIDVRGAGALEDDGHALAVHGQLSLELRRGGITQQVSTQPTGP